MKVSLRRRVNVGVSGKTVVAVTKPGLNIFEGIAKIQHDGGTAVAQVMEADAAKAVFGQDCLKPL